MLGKGKGGWEGKGTCRGQEAEVCVPRRPWTWQVRPRVDSPGGWGAVLGSEGSINSGRRWGRGSSAQREPRKSLASLFITSGLSNARLPGRSDKIKRERKKCQLPPE